MKNLERIYLSAPHVGESERAAVSRVFDSNWIAPLGPEVDQFERELAGYCGRKSAAALSSGTAAVHLALQLLGVGPGDRVIVPSFTFVATANPVIYLGGEPVFVDSEPQTWNLSPEYLRESLRCCAADGRLPKAVIAVDLYGVPADYEKILPICEEYGIPLIEDAAEALGSFVGERAAGSFGKLAVLSFNGNKIITTSGGGALLCNDSAIIERARFLATQARDLAPHYQHSELGYNYRLSNVLAAIGRAQLEELERKVIIRRGHFESYRLALTGLGVKFLSECEGVRANRWLTTVLFPEDKFSVDFHHQVRIGLEKALIESRPLWKPLHLQPLFKDCKYFGESVAEGLFSQGLCLPSGSGLSHDQTARVNTELMKIIALG
jgi:pyridoxal phosphate-dependent aminotransferase EpsN